jgi:hypothetical protein
MSNTSFTNVYPEGVFTDGVISVVDQALKDIGDIVIRVNQDNVSYIMGSIDSTKLYLIDGDVNFTGVSIEVPSTGLFISGHNIDLSFMRCADNNYTMFTGATAGNVFIKDLTIVVNGTNSQVNNVTGATGFEAYECVRVNWNNCTSLGTITGYRQGLETGTGRFGGTPQLTLAGTWIGGYFIDTSIIRSLTAGAYAIYSAGAGFSMASRFRSNQNIDLPTTTNYIDFTGSNFPNTDTLQLIDMLITRNGVTEPNQLSISPNITKSNVASNWKDNIGLNNTFEGGITTISSETATSIGVQGDWYTLNGTWTASELVHFDSPSNGQLRHISNFPRSWKITVNIVMVGTANDVIGIRWRKFDSSASTFSEGNEVLRVINNLQGGSGSRDVAYYNFILNLELDFNDYVYWQVRNNSGTDNVTAELNSEWSIEER